MLEIRWLGLDTLPYVDELLRTSDLLSTNEKIVDLASAGEGNMNVTLRVAIEGTVKRTLIVKQSRPFVAKYDFIPAPLERAEYEAAFYHFAQQHPSISNLMPGLLAWFPDEFALVLEDLGPAVDATSLYAGYPHAQIPDAISQLLNWLLHLHELSHSRIRSNEFGNEKLRKLNHEHIFELPIQDRPACDLDAVCPGLLQSSQKIRENVTLRNKCLELGKLYLSRGPCLLHGDFYPGSWLLTPTGQRVIDPEFCFAGPPEFDLGVLLAHLQMMGCMNAQSFIDAAAESSPVDYSGTLIREFACVEVLRRILGVAQLPLHLDLQQRQDLIEQAAGVLLG